MSLTKAFETAYERMKERKWNQIYVFIDIHKTILYPDYGENKVNKFYPFAKETLQLLTQREDIVLGLYTCSYPKEIEDYLIFFENNGIKFDLVNKNEREKNTGYGYFNDKPYFNVLLDDKAGFDGEKDWKEIRNYLIKVKRKNYLTKMMKDDEELGLYGEKEDGYFSK